MIRRLTIGAAAAALPALVLGAGSAGAQPAPTDAGIAAPSTTIVINEVVPSSGPFGGFAELRNLTDQSINLDGWRLSVCGSTGDPVLVVSFGAADSMPAGGFFVIPTNNVPDDGGWQIGDGFNVVDSVGLGANGCVEGISIPPANPWAPQCDWAVGEAASRDAAGTDTDHNAADFSCQ